MSAGRTRVNLVPPHIADDPRSAFSRFREAEADMVRERERTRVAREAEAAAAARAASRLTQIRRARARGLSDEQIAEHLGE